MKIILVLLIGIVLSQYCKDEKGNQVDWWFILRLPKTVTEINYTYLYCDANIPCNPMKLMTDHLGDVTTPLQQTVQQMLFSSTDTMSVVWNDQHNQQSSHTIGNKAHSKGMLSVSTKQGFIINHSTPNFPAFDSSDAVHASHEMPETSRLWGQHFYCVTMTTLEINKVAEQLIIADVYTQKSSEKATSTFESGYRNIAKLKDNARDQIRSAMHASNTVKSFNGQEIKVFSTNEYDVQDFYANIVAPGLGVGLVIQSWGKSGIQDPDCTDPFHTLSNKWVKHVGYSEPFRPYRSTMDHSKYGISDDKSKPYVCVSDLNREIRQNKRGGTALCFKNLPLWEFIDKSFIQRDTCEVTERRGVKRKASETED